MSTVIGKSGKPPEGDVGVLTEWTSENFSESPPKKRVRNLRRAIERAGVGDGAIA